MKIYKSFPLLCLCLSVAGCIMSETGTKIVNQSQSVMGQVGGSIGSSGSDIGVMLGKTFGWSGSNSNATSLTQQEISLAFKEALSIGSGAVTAQLGQTNGFLLDPQVKIPLPASMAKAQTLLKKAGLSFMLDDLETRLNRAAEIATPHAKEIFISAIASMTFQDVMGIYNGPQNSATQFFQAKTTPAIMDKMRPFVTQAVAQAGVIQSYDTLVSRYSAIPFASALAPDIKTDLSNYVVSKGLEGIFFYLGEQEKQIRQDPVKQTTALLKKVFGIKNPS